MKSFNAWRAKLLATPPDVASDEGQLYFKSDGKLYSKIGSDPEQVVGSGSGSVGSLPAGIILGNLTSTIQSGTLLCDGSIVSRATYPDLFAAIGTTYNTGGETTAQFRLPNLKGRVLVGRDTAQTEFDVIGEIGGTKAETLTVAQIPSHNHPFTGGHSFSWGATGLSQSVYAANAIATGGNPPSNNLVTSQGTYIGTQNVGGGGSHNNLQPYMVGQWVITTGGVVGAAPAVTGEYQETALTGSPSTTALATTMTASFPTLDQTWTVPSASAAYLVQLDVDCYHNGVNCSFELWIDGVKASSKVLYFSQAAASRLPGSKSWTISGLSAGNHTFAIRAQASASGAWIAGTHSTLIVNRIK